MVPRLVSIAGVTYLRQRHAHAKGGRHGELGRGQRQGLMC